MELKEMIMNTLSSNKFFKGVSVEDFKKLFNITSNEEFISLMKTLNELEDNYQIMRDKNNKYFLLSTKQCFKGVFRSNPKGFGFVDGDEMSVFINRKQARKLLDGDEVIAHYTYDKDNNVDGEVIKVISHNLHQIVGTIKIKNNEKYFLSDKDYGRKIKIINYSDFKIKNDTKVLVEIIDYGKVLKAKIVEVIGYKYAPGVDILGIVLEHHIDPVFSSKVIAEADSVSNQNLDAEIARRKDLRSELIITIDGKDSKDLDDAISVKRLDDGFYLGVHIADVSYFVEAKSKLDKEAFNRGCSVYLLDRVIPMLPAILSNGICSLNPHVDRLTLSCEMKIDFNGDVVDYAISESVINSKYRMTYADVNEILKKDDALCEKYHEIVEMLDDALELSKILRNRRRKLGAIDFETKESKFILNDEGKIIDIVPRERFEAEKLIEDFMICANECVASHMLNMDLPCVYRIHEAPDPKKVQDFMGIALAMGYKLVGDPYDMYPKQYQKLLKQAQGDPNFESLSMLMLRSMQKARYDSNCSGHFGLALHDYLHFTSPIRRYPDLMVHRFLRKYYFNNNYDVQMMGDDEYVAKEAADKASERERLAIDCEREVEDMKKCEYMKQFIGEIYEAKVVSVTKFGLFVALDNTVEGLVHVSSMKDDHYNYIEKMRCLKGELTGKTYRMGDVLKVQLVNADKYQKNIDFELVEDDYEG